MNDITDPLEMPKVLQDQLKDFNVDSVSVNQLEGPKTEVTEKDKWANRLWPSMAWFIFAFNVFVAISFCVNILTEGMNNVHSAAMYITIVVTMCGTYMALMWAHHNILRKKNGLG